VHGREPIAAANVGAEGRNGLDAQAVPNGKSGGQGATAKQMQAYQNGTSDKLGIQLPQIGIGGSQGACELRLKLADAAQKVLVGGSGCLCHVRSFMPSRSAVGLPFMASRASAVKSFLSQARFFG
jgi:hypothetical protein